MHFIKPNTLATVSLLILLATLVPALPTPTNTTTATPTFPPTNTILAPRGSYTFTAQCVCLYAEHSFPGNEFEVIVRNETRYTTFPYTCGLDHLHFLRGRCGPITSWECAYIEKEPNIGDAMLKFKTSIFCSRFDVTSALLASTRGEQKIDCDGTCN